MSKRLKALMVKELESDFAGLDRCVIVSLTGVPVIASDKMREKLAGRKARLQIVKNTLAAVALAEVGIKGIDTLLVGPSAVMTGGVDIVDLAKAAAEMAKGEAGFTVKGGYGEGKVLSSAEIDALSKMPGREELLAMLAGAMAATMRNFAGVLGAVQRKFLYGLTALKDKSSAAA